MHWPGDDSWWWFPIALPAVVLVGLGVHELVVAANLAEWIALPAAALSLTLLLRRVPPLRRQLAREWGRE